MVNVRGCSCGSERRKSARFGHPHLAWCDLFRHPVDCRKALHDKPEGGYLHGEDDEAPYDVDGVRYCGRCHMAL